MMGEILDDDNKLVQIGDIRFHVVYRTPFYVLAFDEENNKFLVTTDNLTIVDESIKNVNDSVLKYHFEEVDQGLKHFFKFNEVFNDHME